MPISFIFDINAYIKNAYFYISVGRKKKRKYSTMTTGA